MERVKLLEIRNIAIEKLRAYENNPRRIPELAVKSLVNSIREFGFKVPVVVDENYEIVAGHTRLMAARELGLTGIPCIVADDLTPKQVKAFRLADNKTGELTGWDFEKLDLELEELDIDMSDFGFEINTEDIDTDSFFTKSEHHEHKKENEPKTITCPECGAEFELEE